MNNIVPGSINKTDPCLQPSARNHILLMFQALVQWTSSCNVLGRCIRHKGSSLTHQLWYKVETTLMFCGWCKSHHTFRGRKATAGRQTVYSYLAVFTHGETNIPRANGVWSDGVQYFTIAPTPEKDLPFLPFSLHTKRAHSRGTLRLPSQQGREPSTQAGPSMKAPRVASGALDRHILKVQAPYKQQYLSLSQVTVASGLNSCIVYVLATPHAMSEFAACGLQILWGHKKLLQKATRKPIYCQSFSP